MFDFFRKGISINTLFGILFLNLFVVLIGSNIFTKGMFLDGITYATISRNLAIGLGETFKPHYTQFLYPEFYEHPPLAFILQSYWFKFLGEGYYVEKIYSAFSAVLLFIGMGLNWSLFAKDTEIKSLIWLPLILTLLTPIFIWSYQNNLLENTISVWTVFAIYFSTKALLESKMKYVIFASGLVVLAFLTKGFVGLFPFFVPIIWYIVWRRKLSLSLRMSIFFPLLSILIMGIAFYFMPDLYYNISKYIELQFIPSIIGDRELTTTNRFGIIVQLVLELLPAILIGFGIFLFAKFKKIDFKFPYRKEFLCFFLIGLSASLPMILSLKQRSFYLLPSIPFFVLSLSFLLIPILLSFSSFYSFKLKLFLPIAVSMLCFSWWLCVSKYNSYTRDIAMITDIESIKMELPFGSTMCTKGNFREDWQLIAYLARMHNISLHCDMTNEPFVLLDKSDKRYFEDYYELDLNLKNYRVYERK